MKRERKDVTIYPNPTSGKFQLAIGNKQQVSAPAGLAVGKEYKIEIHNVLGEKVYSSTINDEQLTINLSSQPSGVYFLKVQTDKEQERQRIIIQK